MQDDVRAHGSPEQIAALESETMTLRTGGEAFTYYSVTHSLDGDLLIAIRGSHPVYISADRTWHAVWDECRFPDYYADIKDTTSSTMIPTRVLWQDIAIEDTADGTARRWVGGVGGFWETTLGAFYEAGAPYVRFTPVGDVGAPAHGNYVLSYP